MKKSVPDFKMQSIKPIFIMDYPKLLLEETLRGLLTYLFIHSFIHSFIHLFIFYLRERERERGRESQVGPALSARVEPEAGLNSTNCEIMTSAKIKSWPPNRITQVPQKLDLKKN